jgi:mono/diheme cytochrome c family protein
VETTLANMAKDVVIPIEAERLKSPLPSNDEVAQEGHRIYTQSCGLCHGADGRGTDLGRNMYPPAMDLNSPHVQHWKDAELFWIIQNGVRLTGMPSWKSGISETDTWRLVHFIHSLPRLNAAAGSAAVPAQTSTPVKPEAELIAYGKTLYRQEGCFMCHRLEGEGGRVGPDLTVEGTRGRSNEWLMGHFKDPPKYVAGSIMPPFKNLTDVQLQALTVFLQNQKGR